MRSHSRARREPELEHRGGRGRYGGSPAKWTKFWRWQLGIASPSWRLRRSESLRPIKGAGSERLVTGSQFTAVSFVGLLQKHKIQTSIDGRGAWRYSVFAERLWRSVKYEEVYLHAYDAVAAAKSRIGDYFAFYNIRRPHSALDRLTSDHVYFESQLLAAAA